MTGKPEVWSGFSHDPRRPENAQLRAADRDREAVQQVLAEAYADGRLDRSEFDERSAAAWAARVLGDLPPLVVDLVHVGPAPTTLATTDVEDQAIEMWRGFRRQAFWRFFTASVICWVIWVIAATGSNGFHPGFPWPAFVSLGTGIPLLRVHSERSSIVSSQTRKLEKKQRKELEKPLQAPPSGNGEDQASGSNR